MFYVSSENNGKFGVTDTSDNIEEFYSRKDIKRILSLGISIIGVTTYSDKLVVKVSPLYNESVDLAKRLLVDSIWKSANLEGLGTTFPNTELILENISTNCSRDEVFFIVNMKRAWYFLLDNINYNLNLSFLRELNKIVGDGLFYNNGSIRTTEVSIGGTSWKPAIPYEKSICNKIDEILEMSNKEVSAMKMFCYVARCQMFNDGNKRVAQLVTNKILIENNLGIFQIPVDKLGKFRELLVKFYESNDDSSLIKFMLKYCRVR